MVRELWSQFPRLMEQNINGLLDGAEPTALRAFQIYRTCKNEGLWRDGVENFSKNLREFFARPRHERRKSHFDRFLEQPMDHGLYSLFQLDFRSAAVSDEALSSLASWAHNLIRVSKKTTGSFASPDVLTTTLRRIATPGHLDKAQDIEFDDFCLAWKKTVYKTLGQRESPELTEFAAVLKELEWMSSELKGFRPRAVEIHLSPGIYLTQTELDWAVAVRQAAAEDTELPAFPLSRGPQKDELKNLERVASLYTLARTSRLPEIVHNRDRIRATVLDRCDLLLGNKLKKAA